MLINQSTSPKKLSEFLRYLAYSCQDNHDRLPSLVELSKELGISVTTLREQMEVARVFGLVEVRPKTGMRKLPYNFAPVVKESIGYASTLDPKNFQKFSEFRSHIEAAYWYEATALLTKVDHEILRGLIVSARSKLHSSNPQIPHIEHRQLHLTIYRYIDNPFATGTLEAYWDLYEAFGFDTYLDINYLDNVWNYHQRMVDAIGVGNFSAGYQALSEHMNLIYQRTKPKTSQKFE